MQFSLKFSQRTVPCIFKYAVKLEMFTDTVQVAICQIHVTSIFLLLQYHHNYKLAVSQLLAVLLDSVIIALKFDCFAHAHAVQFSIFVAAVR